MMAKPRFPDHDAIPYHADDDGKIAIYHGDHRALVDGFPDGYFDHIITDPPYSAATHKGARTNPEYHGGGGEEGRPLIDYDHITTDQLRADMERLARVCRRWWVSTMDYKHIVALEADPPKGWRFVRFGVWLKHNGEPQFSGDRPGMGWEGVAILHRSGVDEGRMRWNGRGNHAVWRIWDTEAIRTVWDIPKGGTKKKGGKPVQLYHEILQDFTDPGDLILDPYCGQGSSLRAAKNLERLAVGIELKEADIQEIVVKLAQRPMVGVYDREDRRAQKAKGRRR
jgi:site-specific DNA-methyltransferase (adenine-specific)